MVTGLLALLDDITRILDDVSAITKVAAASRGWKSLVHPWLHRAPGPHVLSEDERTKVRAAVRTDFVLSAEIIVITRHCCRSAAGDTERRDDRHRGVNTAGVYGLVAGIVRADDIGLCLSRRSEAVAGSCDPGGGALSDADPCPSSERPAMFLVGGGILTHGFPGTHEVDISPSPAADVFLLGSMAALAANGLTGIVAGAAVFGGNVRAALGLRRLTA